MAVDHQGHIFVAAASAHLVQKYSGNYQFVTQWGNPPATPGQFSLPNDLVVDAAGNIYVADTYNQRIQKFNAFGVFLTQWVIHIPGNNMPTPIKIVMDPDENLYVLEPMYSQVLKFDLNGNRDIGWELEFGIIGDEDFPTGIAIYQDQYIFVAGGYNNHIHKFSLADGTFIKQWGGLGSGNGNFRYPFDVAVSNDGFVYVADWENYRIQKFDLDGNYITKWGVQGSLPGQFEETTAVKADAYGNIYVLDGVLRTIQVFTSNGHFITRWNTLALAPEQQLASPRGFELTTDGKIFIADTYNQRIQVLSPDMPGVDPETGFIQNGSFASDGMGGFAGGFQSNLVMNANSFADFKRSPVPGLDHWTYGGGLPISRSTFTNETNYSVQLGTPVEVKPQGINEAWISQVFYVPHGNTPYLVFDYNIFTNDSINHADFIVEIQDATGLNNMSVLVRDGYRPPGAGGRPNTTQELGWQTVIRNLGLYRGRFIRLVIRNRNLIPESQGIWSYVENIRVGYELPEISLPLRNYLPLILR